MWRDTNGNGLQDADETAGVGGATVQLWSGTGKKGKPVAQTQTTTKAQDPAAVGTYHFADVPAGTAYTVVVTLPGDSPASAGFTIPAGGAPTDASNDSDVGRDGRSPAFTLGAEGVSVDAGIARAGLSGVAYRDDDGSRGQDPGDVLGPPAREPVTVTLTPADETGTPLPQATPLTTKTDADGAYRFDDLTPGHYLLTAKAASGVPVVSPPKGRAVVLVERGRQQHLDLVLAAGDPG